MLCKVLVGIIIGIAIGFLYSSITTKLSDNNERKIHQAFVAVSLTLISYGLAETINGYGFLSVFFAGLFAHYHMHRNGTKDVSDPNLNFITNVEKFMLVFWMIFFGGSLVAGILNFVNLNIFLFCICSIFIIRPLLGYVALFKSGL